MSASISAIMAAVPALSAADQATYDKIVAYIKAPPQNSRVFNITPPVAQQLIDDFNHGNRPKKAGNIRRYASDMAAKRWPLTGDTIKFTDKPRLGDGQNRFLACIAANVPFTTHMVFGIDDAVFALLDRGKNRDGGDVLQIEGIPNAGQMAQAIRWAELLADTTKVTQRKTLEPHEILSLARTKYRGKGLDDRLVEARAIYATTRHPIGFVAGLLYHLNISSPPKAAAFARAWEARGVVKSKQQGKQIEAMIKALDALSSVSQGRIHDVVRAAWAVQAWNGYKAGRRMTTKSFAYNPTTDDFPDIE